MQLTMRRLQAASQRPDSFRDVTERFARQVWLACAREEMRSRFPVLDDATLDTALAFQDGAARDNLSAIGLG